MLVSHVLEEILIVCTYLQIILVHTIQRVLNKLFLKTKSEIQEFLRTNNQ